MMNLRDLEKKLMQRNMICKGKLKTSANRLMISDKKMQQITNNSKINSEMNLN